MHLSLSGRRLEYSGSSKYSSRYNDAGLYHNSLSTIASRQRKRQGIVQYEVWSCIAKTNLGIWKKTYTDFVRVAFAKADACLE